MLRFSNNTPPQTPQAGNGTARFPFAALCGESLVRGTCPLHACCRPCCPAQAAFAPSVLAPPIRVHAQGAADYIAVAQNFHTVVLTDVPAFVNKEDELRRFIVLVDELYQAKCKLVWSGHAESPSALYDAGETRNTVDVAFAFERCVSRLEEMQTKAYLQSLHALQKRG